jgi:sec-independent protein translocase protein TatA
MFGLGGPELLVIGGIVLLLFGPAKIPALAGSIGKGIREFKKGVKEIEVSVATPEPVPTAAIAPTPSATVTK